MEKDSFPAFENKNTPHLPPVPENSPVVNMDINLGRKLYEKHGKLMEIDFDYENYQKIQQDMNSGEMPNNSKLSIMLGGIDGDNSGTYRRARSPEDLALLDVHDKALLKSPKEASKTTIHETKHHIDELNGELSEKGAFYQAGINSLSYKNQIKSIKHQLAGSSVAAAGLAAEISPYANERIPENIAEAMQYGGLTWAVGTIAVTATLASFYLAEHGERRARKAEKQFKKENIISIKPQG